MLIMLGILVYYIYTICCRSVAQPGSASGLGPEGREFESLHSDHFQKKCHKINRLIAKVSHAFLGVGHFTTLFFLKC